MAGTKSEFLEKQPGMADQAKQQDDTIRDEQLKLEVPPVAVPLPMLDLEPSVVPGVGAS